MNALGQEPAESPAEIHYTNFPDEIPEYGSDYEQNCNWLAIYDQTVFRQSVFYKGLILAISEQNARIRAH